MRERLAVGIREAGEMLGVSGRSVQNYLRSGRIRGRKLGRRTVIPVTELSRLLDGATVTSGEPKQEPAVTV